MSTARPTIPFYEFTKFDAHGKLDLNKTLGTLIKATWNHTGTIKIRGNLTVRQEVINDKNRIVILSDNRADQIRLHWLKPWFGDDIDISSDGDHMHGINVNFDLFDRQFILPYVDELRAHLSGRQPAEILMLEGFQQFTRCCSYPRAVEFDTKEMPALDEKSGKVVFKLRDGTSVVGATKIRKKQQFHCLDLIGRVCHLESLEKAKQYEQLLRLPKDKLIMIVVAETEPRMVIEKEAKSLFSFFSKKPESEKKQNLRTLLILLGAFGEYRRQPTGQSLLALLRKIIVEYIITTLLPTLTVADLLQRVPRDTYSYFEFLVYTRNSEILKTVFDKAHKEGVDLNNLDGYTALLYVSGFNDISLLERQKIVTQFFDAGIRFTPELAKMVSSDHLRNEIQQLYDARNKPVTLASSPVWSVTWEETKPVIPFERAARFDAKHKLDVVATLGELLKQTCNATARDAKEQSRIIGTLSLIGDKETVTIQSDHKEDNLQQLSFWLGAVGEAWEGNGIVARLGMLDRHFILPYLADFTRHLDGKHPLATSPWFFSFCIHNEREDFVRNNGLEQMHADKVVNVQNWKDVHNSEQNYINDFIDAMIDWFDQSVVQSISIGIRKHVANIIQHELLPALKKEHFDPLLIAKMLGFYERTLFNSVLARLRDENIDLNSYFHRHPLMWLSPKLYFTVIKDLSPIERQWYVRRMLDEDVVITIDLESAMNRGDMHQSDVLLIRGEFFKRYKKIFADVQGFLSADPSRQVMRFLVGDEYVEKTLKEQPRAFPAFTLTLSRTQDSLAANISGAGEGTSEAASVANTKSAFFVPSPAPGNFAEEKSGVRERVRVRASHESAPSLKRTRSYP